MAKKPRSEWSEAYRRRIERAEAQGKSRQQARGHKAREHVTRKARSLARSGLTPSERAQVAKFARKQANRAGSGNPDQAVLNLTAWAGQHGYQRFKQLKAKVAQRAGAPRERAWVAREGPGGETWVHVSLGSNTQAMQEDFYDFDLPEMPDGDELGWLYYH